MIVLLPFLTPLIFRCSLQAIVYFSVRVEKEKLNQSGLTTELSGTNASRNEAPYVSADDAGMANSESTSLPKNLFILHGTREGHPQ